MIIIPFLNGYFIGNIPNMFRQTQIDMIYETPWIIVYGFSWLFNDCLIV